MNRQFKFAGSLPANGDWRFLLVVIEGQSDVVLVVDRNGRNAPRMVIDGKLVEVQPV